MTITMGDLLEYADANPEDAPLDLAAHRIFEYVDKASGIEEILKLGDVLRSDVKKLIKGALIPLLCEQLQKVPTQHTFDAICLLKMANDFNIDLSVLETAGASGTAGSLTKKNGMVRGLRA